jgi:Cdc6-like AAA superfamily ATPase
MDLLSIASGISGLITLAESVFNVTFSYCKDVKYAQKDISRFSAQISALSGTLYRLALLCRRLESQRLQSGINHEDIHTCQKLLETIEKKLTIDENPRELKRNGFKKLLQRTTWPLTKPEVEELLSQVENMRATFDLALSAENMSTLVNMSESIVSMKKELDRRWNIETRIRLNEERNKVLKFFKPVDPSQNHQTNSQLKQEGTGHWLTKGEDFQNWLKSPNRSLWLYGIPGAGKTVLASSIIQETIQQSRKGEAVCYFYCDYRDKSRQNSRNIFGAIAAQLGVQDEQAYEILKRHYELMQKESKAYTNLTVNQILIIIKEQISAFNTCSFILDGLDECGDHIADVLDAWITMESSSQSMLRTVILSREIDLIQRRLSQESYLEISIAAQSSDIRLYVAAEIEKRTRKGSWIIEDSELNSYIMKRLVEKAQGM